MLQIQFEDLKFNRAMTKVDNATDDLLVDAFLTALDPLTAAKITKGVFSAYTNFATGALTAGAWDDIGAYAKCYFYFTEASGRQNIVMNIPAPKDSILEDSKKGVKVKKTEGDLIAAAIKTALGLTPTVYFVRGKLYDDHRVAI